MRSSRPLLIALRSSRAGAASGEAAPKWAGGDAVPPRAAILVFPIGIVVRDPALKLGGEILGGGRAQHQFLQPSVDDLLDALGVHLVIEHRQHLAGRRREAVARL